MNIEIANRLVVLRKESGFSQEELAQKLGISRQAVSKWERAESYPDTNNLIALSKLYNISMDALLECDEESVENEKYAQLFDDFNQAERRRPDFFDDFNQAERRRPDFFDDFNQAERRRPDFFEPVKPRTNLFYFPYPLVVTALYLALGWATNMWYVYRFIFLTIPLYYATASFIHLRRK